MNSQTIRQSFLDFFKSKEHVFVPSSSIVVQDDSSLMFTNAGMNQFKNIFLGNDKSEIQRAVNTQRCLRVSGKHNDLEEVGYDGYHHTMFEMLGNWSFGDYFKKEAIQWAWDWLTKELQLSPDRMCVTYFSGDIEDKLDKDEETRNLWETIVSKDKILPFGKAENFWEMGNIGPCGPSSEIHYDCRLDEDRKKNDFSLLVNKGHPEVIEIWNLVFIQYNKNQNGKLIELGNKYIDTGLGFERIVRVKQKVKSNYDTDLFREYFDLIEQITGFNYSSSDSKQGIAMRVLVDHARALTFAIADGQMPSNTGAGYVIRRILRRAVRYYYSFLNRKEPMLYKLSEICFKKFINVFPEIQDSKNLVLNTICDEEKKFLHTLAFGLKRIDELVSDTSQKKISGIEVFKLYDTYGFPFDLSQMILKEKGFTINSQEFEQELYKQKERSRQDQKTEITDWKVIEEGKSIFVGYDTLQAQTSVLKYREVEYKGENIVQIVLKENPFYAESGGQKGDSGFLQIGEEKVHIFDAIRENALPILLAKKTFSLSLLQENVFAQVNTTKRRKIAQHHTATHLLNATLQSVLGDHVKQKGAYLDDTYLRFDFSHNGKIEKDALVEIEKIINEKIQLNLPVHTNIVPKEEALERATAAMFGEKYGDKVRLISIDEKKYFSVELCGGTHVKATGEIGVFKIIKESSIASGIRRIEAVVAEPALNFLDSKMDTLDTLNILLKKPKDIVLACQKLQASVKEAKEISEVWKKALLCELMKNTSKYISELSNKKVFIQILNISMPEIANALARQVLQNNLAQIACVGVIAEKNKHHFFLTKSKQLDFDCKEFVQTHILIHPENTGGGNSQQSVFITDGSCTEEKLLALFSKNI